MFRKTPSKIIEQELRMWIEAVWKLSRESERNVYALDQKSKGIGLWRDAESVLHDALVESVDRLERTFISEKLGTGAADLYFHPLDWLHVGETYGKKAPDQYETAMFYVLETLIYLHPPSDLLKRFEGRMSTILEHPYLGGEKGVTSWPPGNHHPPDLEDLGRIFPHLEPTDEVLDYASRVLRGEFNVDIVVAPIKEPQNYRKAYDAYGTRLPTLRIMEYIHQHSDLTYELFCEALRQNTSVLHWHSHSLPYWRRDREVRPGEPAKGYDYADSFFELSELFLGRFADELAAELTDENYLYLKKMQNLRGHRWLVKAAEVHRDFKLKKLAVGAPFKKYEERWKSKEALVIHLANVSESLPEDPEEYRQLVEDLNKFPPRTLQYMLPIVREARDLILEVLEWESAKPLVDFVLELGSRTFGSPYAGKTDMPNSPDPTSGAVDLKRYREVQEIAGETLSQEILELFYDASVGLNNTITILRAADGAGREKILKRLEKSKKRRDQKMIKAYGLLPLEHGDKELFERYIFLQEFMKDSKKAEHERQANERGAIKTALFHLAQLGGYPDVMRLEWDMESRLATEVVPVGKHWVVDDYNVELQVRGSDPDLVITRNDKQLKSVPKAVRASDQYPIIKASVEEIREQARRFRSFFEDMMSTGKVIKREDLVLLNRMPVPTFMLSQLILQTADGELGLYSPEGISVRTLDGRERSIQDAAIIAHPYHLYEADQLGDWQQFLVHQRIVQPFKQVFRELYILTPAEIEAGTYSNRYAGHLVDGGVAVRLFQSRNWDFEKGDRPTPQKLFPDFGFSARFVFPDVMQYWSSNFPVTSDQVKFRIHPYRMSEYRDRQDEALIPLAEIPPTIFSEVMRDADLVVSVATVGEREFLSREIVQSRIELVKALMEDLELEGVRFEDHFAHVQGKLANYRIHMGSAVIHIEPGNYLCVVPERWGNEHKDVFLPFSDAGDSKTSEVISKIFLLMNDDKIKDKLIKRQIERDM